MYFVEVFTGLLKDELVKGSLFLVGEKVAFCSLVFDYGREDHADLTFYLHHSLFQVDSFEEYLAVEHPQFLQVLIVKLVHRLARFWR